MSGLSADDRVHPQNFQVLVQAGSFTQLYSAEMLKYSAAAESDADRSHSAAHGHHVAAPGRWFLGPSIKKNGRQIDNRYRIVNTLCQRRLVQKRADRISSPLTKTKLITISYEWTGIQEVHLANFVWPTTTQPL